MYPTRTHETIVMPHEEVTFYLLESIEYHTNQNQKCRATEELGELGLDIQQASESRHTCDGCEEQRTWQRDVVHHPIDVFSSLMTWTNAGYESVVPSHIFSHLRWIERNGCIEICERYNQDGKEYVVAPTRMV